jgi:predicted RNA methylase
VSRTLLDLLDAVNQFGAVNEFETFGWKDWKRVGANMVSPGGRTLKYETWQRLSTAAGHKPDEAPQPGPAGVAAPTPAPTSLATPEGTVAEQVAAKLRAGQPLTAKDLFGMADKAFGKNRAAGGYGPSEAYDAMEAGTNLALLGRTDPTADAASAADQVKKLGESVVRQLPTQTNRSGNKDLLQQFSTPPHYGFVAAWLANLSADDVVLEPSGGTGSLAVHAKNAGSAVVGNELDPRRAALLRQVINGPVTTENAEQIGAILRGKVTPTAVVMNPPFSSTAGRTDKKDLGTAAKHIDESLALLTPGGRLVAIVGRGMTENSATFRRWFAGLAARGYTLRANVGVAGDEYVKSGTGFGTRILVIDKEQSDAAAVRGDVATVGELIPLLSGVRDDRPSPLGRTPGGDGGGETTAGVTGGADPRGQPAGDAGGRGGAAAGGEPGAGGAGGGLAAPLAGAGGVDAGGQLRGAGVGGKRRGPGAGVGRAGGTPQPAGGDPGTAAGKPGRQSKARVPELRPPEPVTLEAAEPPARPVVGQSEESLYDGYRPAVRVKGAKPHPAPLVESAAMAAVTMPKATYTPTLSPDLLEGGALSDAALESIVYAGQNHSTYLPSGGTVLTPGESYMDPAGVPHALVKMEGGGKATWHLDGGAKWENFRTEEEARKFMADGGWTAPSGEKVTSEQLVRRGFFIGDGTGAGKGRQIAGTITDNWNQGRRKHVWVSLKSPLLEDARRDWRDVGNDPEQIVPFDKLKGEAPPKEGIAFVTYDTLKSKPKDPAAPSNLQRLADWLGKDFDGVIAFDEAHAMGNSVETEGARGAKGPSQKALAGVELQKMLPNARVLYVSATGATEVSNLAFADRLGLWGRGTAFPDKQNFIAEMSNGGVAAMEAVAQSLKASGSYTARSLSLNDGTEEGKVTYDRVTHKLTPDQLDQYNAAADGWQNVLQNIEAAMESSGANQDRFARSAAKSAFWGSQQRFFNQMMTSMQTPSVIRAMEQDIKEGRAPVVQLVNTMEAATGRAVSRAASEGDGSFENVDVSPKEILMQYLDRSFPVHRYEAYTDDEGNDRTRVVTDSAGLPVIDPAAQAMKEALLDQLGSLRIPSSPLDQIIDHFGPDQVAEATGRGERLVWKTMPDGEKRRVLESRNPAVANVAEASAFQGGKKKLLVFSDAGGTGRSYHADRTAANQAKRVHYMLQPGWRADNAVQGLGRTHRTNQAVAPHYRLVEIDELKAQKRFVSTIARRLDQLGALTKGQRQTGGGGLFSAADNLESREARTALDSLFSDLSRNRVEGLDFKDTMKQLGFATEDREGRPKEVETPPMGQFLNRLLSLRVDKQAKVFDEFDTRLKKAVEGAVASGTLDQGVENFKADKIERQGEKVVFRHPETGAEARLLTVKAQRKIARMPFEATQRGDKPIGYFRDTETDKVRAAYKWIDETDDYGTVRQQVGMRGPTGLIDAKKPTPYDLQYGKRWEKIEEPEARKLWDEQLNALPQYQESEEHFLTGAILPIWDRVPKDHARVYRVKSADGLAAVGRYVPAKQVDTLLKNLGMTPDAKVYTPEATLPKLETGRSTAKLANGWLLKPVRVQGERRVELIGSGFGDLNQLKADGAIAERINWSTRVFVPTGPTGVSVLKKILSNRPIVEVNDVEDFRERSTKPAAGGTWEEFAWSDWKDNGKGGMSSPGGRTLSKAVFDRMSKRAAAGKPAKATKPAGGDLFEKVKAAQLDASVGTEQLEAWADELVKTATPAALKQMWGKLGFKATPPTGEALRAKVRQSLLARRGSKERADEKPIAAKKVPPAAEQGVKKTRAEKEMTIGDAEWQLGVHGIGRLLRSEMAGGKHVYTVKKPDGTEVKMTPDDVVLSIRQAKADQAKRIKVAEALAAGVPGKVAETPPSLARTEGYTPLGGLAGLPKAPPEQPVEDPAPPPLAPGSFGLAQQMQYSLREHLRRSAGAKRIRRPLSEFRPEDRAFWSRHGETNLFELFMWVPQQTRRGNMKAVWQGSGAKEPLYGADAVAALKAQSAPGRMDRVKAAGRHVATVAKRVDAAVGNKAGVAGQKFQAKRRQIGDAVKRKAAETAVGRLVSWLATTEVGKGGAAVLDRRAQRVEATAADMKNRGYVRGQVGGAKRAIGYLTSKFVANKRRYGLIPAIGIEAAVFTLAKGIPVGLTLGLGAVGGMLGSGLGVGGLAAGAGAGMLIGGNIAKRFLRLISGPIYSQIARATVEAASRKAATIGRQSAARLRKRAGTKLSVQTMAEVPPGIDDLANEVCVTMRTRYGVDVSPDDAADALAAVFAAIGGGDDVPPTVETVPGQLAA